ncbi:MAG TPA: hypothetical protein VGN70_09595 [Gammaproteobacteria bacterium]
MDTRLRHAYFGLIAGFVTGLLPALLLLSSGSWVWALYVIGGFMLVEASVGFLLPKKATNFFIDLMVGFFENANI